ncbi:MAG: hypothetical protein QXX95_07780 [Nitrososphaerales archaeon]
MNRKKKFLIVAYVILPLIMLSHALFGLFLGFKINEIRGDTSPWFPIILSLAALFLSLLTTFPLANRLLK